MGSPQQHAKVARDFEATAGDDLKRVHRALRGRRCTQALMDLLGARMAIGAASSEATWTEDKRSRPLSQLFRDHTGATLAFEQACLRER